MRDVVIIEKWPAAEGAHRVYFHGKEVATIYGLIGRWYPTQHYPKLLDCDKEIVNEHIDEFICVLQITNRLTS